jgi:putative AlgH/UPF0301 family transcriptional regulator
MRKLHFFTMLAAIVAFAAVARLGPRILKFDPLPANNFEPLPWLNSLRPESEIAPAAFLPVQSKNTKELRTGKLLVASRDLGDPHFAETVVLLVRYDEKGVLGLILNRRTDVPVSRALEDLKAAKSHSEPVYLGGPVEPAAVFGLFQSRDKVEGAEHIFGGVYLIAAKPLFEQTISARPDPGVFHVYLGYAGWTEEQLQKEVELGAWFIFPAEANMVFDSDPDSLWLHMIRKTELKLAAREPRDPDPSERAVQFPGWPISEWSRRVTLE